MERDEQQGGRGAQGVLRPCVCVCVGVCAIIVLTAFGQFSAAFLGGQRELDAAR